MHAMHSIKLVRLPFKVLGELDELGARRIIPRQALGEAQTSLSFFAKIRCIHGWLPIFCACIASQPT
jgi:hypothetical protein